MSATKNNIYVSDPELQKFVSTWPDLDVVYSGCKTLTGLDAQGNLYYRMFIGLREEYWHDIVALAHDKYNTDVILGLKKDGICVVTKRPFGGFIDGIEDYENTNQGNWWFSWLLRTVHSWKEIVQIAVSGNLFLALDKNGKLHSARYTKNYLVYSLNYYPNTRDSVDEINDQVSTLSDVRRILVAERNLIIVQKNNGEIVYVYKNRNVSCLTELINKYKLYDKEIVEACGFYDWECMLYAFRDADGYMYRELHETDDRRFKQLVGYDHTFLGLSLDGSIVHILGDFEEESRIWPKMKQISLGRKGNFDELFLVGISK